MNREPIQKKRYSAESMARAQRAYHEIMMPAKIAYAEAMTRISHRQKVDESIAWRALADANIAAARAFEAVLYEEAAS